MSTSQGRQFGNSRSTNRNLDGQMALTCKASAAKSACGGPMRRMGGVNSVCPARWSGNRQDGRTGRQPHRQLFCQVGTCAHEWLRQAASRSHVALQCPLCCLSMLSALACDPHPSRTASPGEHCVYLGLDARLTPGQRQTDRQTPSLASRPTQLASAAGWSPVQNTLTRRHWE
jgi:hypothetical protein